MTRRIELGDRYNELVDKLAAQEESTQKGVIRRALVLYDMVQDHHLSGGEVILRRADGTEITIKILL